MASWLAAVPKVLWSQPPEAGGNVGQRLPTGGNPQPQPLPGAWGVEGTSPSKSPGGTLLKNKRAGLECPGPLRLPGRQPAPPEPDKPGPIERSKCKCDSHFHCPGQFCCQTQGCSTPTLTAWCVSPGPDKSPLRPSVGNSTVVTRLGFSTNQKCFPLRS